MDLHFETEIRAGHVRAATLGIFWRQVLQPVPLAAAAGLLTGIQIVFWAVQAPLGLCGRLVLLAVTSGGMMGVLMSVARHYSSQALRNFARFKGAPVRIRFGADRYCYKAAWGADAIEWSRFRSLWYFKDVWVLLQHSCGGASVLLPSEDLNDECRAFLKERLAREGARVVG